MLRIKELREQAGLTQKQLADGISNMQRNVSNWEKGVSEPDLSTVAALADYFDVSLDELFGRDRVDADDADSALFRAINKLSAEQKRALYTLIKKQ